LQESAHYDFPVLTEYRLTDLLIYEIMKLYPQHKYNVKTYIVQTVKKISVF